MSKPGMPTSTKKAVILGRGPRGVSSWPVAAKTMAKSGITGPDMKCFDPVKIQSLPSRLALLFIDMMSEPASGSLSAKSSRLAPVTHGAKYCSFWAPSVARSNSVGRATHA